MLARTYDLLKTRTTRSTSIGGGLAPRGRRQPAAGTRHTHSPVQFLMDMGAAYRKLKRTRPIMDAFAFHPYPEYARISPEFPAPEDEEHRDGRLQQARPDAREGVQGDGPARRDAPDHLRRVRTQSIIPGEDRHYTNLRDPPRVTRSTGRRRRRSTSRRSSFALPAERDGAALLPYRGRAECDRVAVGSVLRGRHGEVEPRPVRTAIFKAATATSSAAPSPAGPTSLKTVVFPVEKKSRSRTRSGSSSSTCVTKSAMSPGSRSTRRRPGRRSEGDVEPNVQTDVLLRLGRAAHARAGLPRRRRAPGSGAGSGRRCSRTGRCSAPSRRRRPRRRRRRSPPPPPLRRRQAATEARERPARGQYVAYTFFRVRPEWRALPVEERIAGKDAFGEVVDELAPRFEHLRAYSCTGVRPDCDFFLWKITERYEELGNLGAALNGTPLAAWLETPYSYSRPRRRRSTRARAGRARSCPATRRTSSSTRS